jgi:hypothetical protein
MRPWVLAAAVLVPALALAQTPAPAPAARGGFAEPSTAHHTMPPKPKAMPIPKWNPATVATVSGKLVGVWRDRHYGVVVGVDTDKEDVVLLSVGPSYFIDPKITFASDDQIEATGSRVDYNGHTEMLVSTLKRGDLTVKVRTDKGKKLW